MQPCQWPLFRSVGWLDWILVWFATFSWCCNRFSSGGSRAWCSLWRYDRLGMRLVLFLRWCVRFRFGFRSGVEDVSRRQDHLFSSNPGTYTAIPPYTLHSLKTALYVFLLSSHIAPYAVDLVPFVSWWTRGRLPFPSPDMDATDGVLQFLRESIRILKLGKLCWFYKEKNTILQIHVLL